MPRAYGTVENARWQAKALAPPARKTFDDKVGQTLPSANPAIAWAFLRWGVFLIAGFLQAGHPAFRLFTTADGLVRNWINQIRRDSKGHLWFCTVEGLSLFDGYRFTNFSTRDGLPSRLVTDVLETRSGEYWIASTGGLSRFHPSARPGAGHFENFRLGPTTASNDVNALMEASDGAIWCATGAGLYRLHLAAPALAPELIPLAPGRAVETFTLLEDARHRIWAGALDGLYMLSRDGSVDYFGAERGVTDEIDALALDRRGNLWAGGRGGLTQVFLDAEKPVLGERYKDVHGKLLQVMALAPAGNGDIWVGSRGLIRFRPDAPPASRFTTISRVDALENLDIFSLALDAHGNLWAGISTLGAGRLSREPSELFSEADGLQSTSVFGLMEDRLGRFYAFTGALTHTLNEFTGDRFEVRSLRARQPDVGWGQGSLGLQDRAGYWWFASGRGVLRYPPSSDARSLAQSTPRVYTERDGLPHIIILRLFEDSRGDIWAGTPEGVACWSRANDRWTSYATPSSRSSPVHTFAEDPTGAIWVGYATAGLQRIRGSHSETVSAGVPGGFINALLVDRRGRLWIGSSQGGVGRVDSPGAAHPQIRTYTIAQGLTSDHVFALAEDRWGRLYIAGGRGVDRLDPESGLVRHFTEANGLPGGETERLLRDHEGNIWFASNFGLARYRPEPDKIAAPPAPTIHRVSIAGVSYPVSAFGETTLSGLDLSPRQNRLELEYRSLHFAVGEPLLYQYRLSASDPWSAPSEEQSVQYANLSPGRYRFEVRSVGETGLTSAPAAVEFRLLPEFWQRGWFVLIVAAVLSASAYGLHRYRLNQLLAVERVRTRLATDLHDDLGAGLAEIAILSEVARRKPVGETEVLGHVAERARGLRAALSDIVWTVDPRRDRLSDLVQRMRQTALSMLESEDRRVAFVAPPEEQLETIDLPPDLRRHLWLFFKEAVTNVARHSGASDVSVDVSFSARQLRLKIRDNGCGFDPEAPNGGQGLVSLRYRAAELRGVLRLDSGVGRGTEIELVVPLAV